MFSKIERYILTPVSSIYQPQNITSSFLIAQSSQNFLDVQNLLLVTKPTEKFREIKLLGEQECFFLLTPKICISHYWRRCFFCSHHTTFSYHMSTSPQPPLSGRQNSNSGQTGRSCIMTCTVISILAAHSHAIPHS